MIQSKILSLSINNFANYQFQTLYNFIKKYRLPSEIDFKNVPTDQLQFIRQYISSTFNINYNSEDYCPGLFRLEQHPNQEEYENIIKSLKKTEKSFLDKLEIVLRQHLELYSTEQIDKLTNDLRDALTALREWKLPYNNILLINKLPTQEINKIQNEFMLRILCNNTLIIPNAYQEEVNTANDTFLAVYQHILKYDNNLSLTDWLLLSLAANIYDLSTKSLQPVISNFKSPEALVPLLLHGAFHKSIFTTETINILLENKFIISYLKKGYYIFLIKNINDLKKIKKSISSDEMKRLEENLALCQNSLDGLRSNKEIINNSALLMRKLMNEPRIVYLADNAGEVIIDLAFLQKLKEARKNNPPEIHLLSRQNNMQNDIDAITLNRIINANFPDLSGIDELNQLHNSTLLGHDLNEFKPQLIKTMEKSLVISKGLGNILTLQKTTFPIYFVFVSKGFVGVKKISKLIYGEERLNHPIIYFAPAGNDLRKHYFDI